MKSIYRTEEGRQTMAAWYEQFETALASRGLPLRHESIATRFGETNVVRGGPSDAPTLVCFHGVMASAASGLWQMPGLLERFQVVFPDTVGQPGRSDERRLDWQGIDHGYWALDVLDGLGLDQFTAFGISLGGYVILRLAQVAPERVSRAVLWAPGGLVKPPLAPMFGLIFDALVYNVTGSEPRLRKVLAKTFTDLDDDYVRFFADSLAHVHPDRRFPQVLPAGALSNWDAEVLLIVNEHDDVFPADRVLARAETELPQVVDTMMMEGFAHMPPFADGAVDGLLDRVAQFVRSGA